MKLIRYGAVAAFALLSLPLFAQNTIDEVLRQIEINNAALQALRHETEAQKLENRSGITLDDPEVEFGYNWGSPASVTDKIELSVTQSFDLSAVAGLKGKVAKERNKLADWQYRSERRQILLEAKNLCLELVYYNALEELLSAYRDQAGQLVAHQRKSLEHGNSNRLEYNNAVLRMAAVEGEYAQVETGRRTAIARLTAMNGGNRPEFNATAYEALGMEDNFDDWFERASAENPELQSAEQSVVVQKKQLALARSQWAPSLSLGYAGEFEGDESHHGIAVGLSLPLWANLHQVKQSKAAMQAAQYREEDTRLQFRSTLEILYRKTLGLKRVAEIYRASLNESDNRSLLQKALDEGNISVLDFLTEMELYYEAVRRTLEAEKDFRQAHAELSAFEL
ncbi:MAG: TolC family protein [Bacteroides sp.]|nr:TolC family protein [Bacteroides sp.]MCM1085336.1 TolC family protein [Bacteroides sp.]